MQCPYCGSDIPNSCAFCPDCGKSVSSVYPANEYETKQTQEETGTSKKSYWDDLPPSGASTNYQDNCQNSSYDNTNYQQNPYQNHGNNLYSQQPVIQRETVVFKEEPSGTAGFLCSLIGLFACPIILGIIGLVLSNKAINNGCTSGLAKAGKIIGIIDIVLSGLAILTAILVSCSISTYTGLYM